MKNTISQVFDVPKIKQFELYVDRLFSNPDKKSNGIIYFIKYNNLNKSILPKNILSFYNSHKEKHDLT